MNLSRTIRALALGLALSTGAGAALAACPAGLPPGVVCGAKDANLAPAGIYKIDASHASVIAAVSHIGYSRSMFRFGDVAGELVWNPAQPAASRLSATVQTASIATPVAGFAKELAGKDYLNSAGFPAASFVSTAFRPTSATHGEVDGQLTLLGKTAPVTFVVDLVGAGPGFGKPRMGATARTSIDPQAFGMSPFFLDPIELTIDVEFEKAS